jgi:hypothetical protein
MTDFAYVDEFRIATAKWAALGFSISDEHLAALKRDLAGGDCDLCRFPVVFALIGSLEDARQPGAMTEAAAALLNLLAELRAAREVVEAAPVAITLRTDEAFYGAMNRLADALAAYRAVVGEA